ncbi:MAG: isoprenylcysteine carboxylmethyltransferase family protein [Anaerolineales bacterium]|nr:isoprenylcysteine carboxylmethyltransferase family protein [Anaerolineales bacterium]
MYNHKHMPGNLPHSTAIQRRVVFIFYSGLLTMVLLALGIDHICGEWGRLQLGWLNPVIGVSFSSIGTALLSWAVRVQVIIGKGTPAPKVATQRLVTQAPYSWTRNPMTLGALILYLGIGIWIESGLVILLTLIIFSGLLRYIKVHETAELAKRFGDAYLEYHKQTPFLIPRIRRR